VSHWRHMMDNDSEWLGAWDFYDADGNARDRVGRVVAVRAVQLPGTGEMKANRKPVITLADSRGVEWPKKLIVNATIGKTIQSMYGPNPKGWTNKLVALYASTTRGARGGMVDCVRVRPEPPRGQAQAAPDRPVDPEMRAAQVAEMGPRDD